MRQKGTATKGNSYKDTVNKMARFLQELIVDQKKRDETAAG